VATRTTPRVTVTCSGCGFTFELSRRTKLEHERRGVPYCCRACRYPDAGPTRAAVDTMKGWWITTYGLTEVRSWPRL